MISSSSSWIKVVRVVAVVVVSNNCIVPFVGAYSTGAGGCGGGGAAVSGLHLAGTPQTGALSDKGLSVLLDDAPLSTTESTSFTTGTNHTLTLQIDSDIYRGLLFRLGVGAGALLVNDAIDSTVQVSSICETGGASGVTHKDPSNKTSSKAILRLDTAQTGAPLEVTVVISNFNGVSEYYYSKYTLDAVAATTNATTAPSTTVNTTTTTAAPTTPSPAVGTTRPVSPTTSPVSPTTTSPVSPTSSPVSPTSSPVSPTTTSPAPPTTTSPAPPTTKAPSSTSSANSMKDSWTMMMMMILFVSSYLLSSST